MAKKKPKRRKDRPIPQQLIIEGRHYFLHLLRLRDINGEIVATRVHPDDHAEALAEGGVFATSYLPFRSLNDAFADDHPVETEL